MLRDDLVRYWIAEGFVQEQETQLLEDTAEEYYYELIYRNLLQPNETIADYARCKMHDLLRKLAQHLSGEDIFCGDSQSLETKSLTKLRCITIVTGKEFSIAPSMQKEHIIRVRTLTTMCNALEVKNTIVKTLPNIRVLDLTSSILQSIPDCIGSLIHLRSLDLDATDISHLPESIGWLLNLQILNLQRCRVLQSLPLGITRLCNLRRLGLARTPIKVVPKGIGRLRFLNDLEGFPAGGDYDNTTRMQDGWNLEELEPLLQLRKLEIIKLERVSLGITSALLKDKEFLKHLYLQCTEQT